MNKWIAEFDLEDGDTMPEHMDLEYKGAKIDFHCRPMWIPVSEKTPEHGGEYLLWGKICDDDDEEYCFLGDYYEFEEKFGIEQGIYDPHTLGFLGTEIDEYYSVVAWMPLPEPYSEQGDTNKSPSEIRKAFGEKIISECQEQAKRLKNLDTINGLCGAVAIVHDLLDHEDWKDETSR